MAMHALDDRDHDAEDPLLADAAFEWGSRSVFTCIAARMLHRAPEHPAELQWR